MNNQKIDNQLNLSLDLSPEQREQSTDLSAGYNNITNTWEIVVKYNGDLSNLSELIIDTTILDNQIAILVVPENSIDLLAKSPQIEYVEKPRTLYFELDTSTRASCVNPVWNPPNSLTGKGVLLGIIDTGIDYFHKDFRNEDGSTRILNIFDLEQNRVYSQEEINEALNQETRQAGLDMVNSIDTNGHGTHVAGIAGGNGRASDGRYKGVAFESDFLIVKLGRKQGKYLTTELMKAVSFIIKKAEELKQPVAINISFGNNYGSHDGQSLFENYMNNASNEWKNVIVVGSGNEGTFAHHYENMMTEGEEVLVEFNMSEFERNVSLQIWKGYYDTFLYEIIAPSGNTTGILRPFPGTGTYGLDNTLIYVYFGEPSPFNKDQEIYFEMTPRNGDYIDAGIWKIKVIPEKVVVGNIDMWLPTESALNSDTKFLEPSVNTTLTIPSTVANVITVGAYDAKSDSIGPFSGRGYLRENNLVKPDLVAPGVNIVSADIGGGYDSKTGTSMATPFVTGASALLMEWGIVEENDPFLYGQKVKAYLIRSARRDDNIEYPNNAWGYGRLCLANVFNSPMALIKGMASHMEDYVDLINVDCEEAILSDQYVDVIVEYTESVEEILEKYQPTCVQVIDDQYAILHIYGGDLDTCIENEELLDTNVLPKPISLYGKSAINASGILPFHTFDYVPLTGAGTIIGIVDTGIDYTHEVFRYEDNTSKILSIWDQTISGNPPEGYAYGSEYANEMINEALNSENPFEVVPSIDENGHGTFLAGISGGRENLEADFVGAAPDADLMVVKLKEAKKCLREYYLIQDDYNPVYQDTDLIMAVKYLIEKSKEYKKPISIIIGLGSNEGAHDGSSITESYLLKMANRRGNVISVAGGNESNKGHHHFGRFLKGDNSKDIEINVADNEKGIIINIWNHAPDKMSIAITSPTGEYIDKIPLRLNRTEPIKLILENSVITISYNISEERTGDQLIRLRIAAPTKGIWKIVLFNELIVDGRYNAWIQREGFIKDTTKFLMPNPYTTVTFPSTSIGLITTGAYNHQTNSLYSASGRGLTRDDEMKPDLVAPGVNVIGPFPKNQFISYTGTSVAAAITGGASALLLEWGIVLGNDPEMDTEKAKNYLIRGAERSDNMIYPNREWGACVIIMLS